MTSFTLFRNMMSWTIFRSVMSWTILRNMMSFTIQHDINDYIQKHNVMQYIQKHGIMQYIQKHNIVLYLETLHHVLHLETWRHVQYLKSRCSILYLETRILSPIVTINKRLQHINGQGEDNCRVLLSGNGIQSLKVAKLNSCWRFCDDVSSLLQCTRCLLLTFCSNDLTSKYMRKYTCFTILKQIFFYQIKYIYITM